MVSLDFPIAPALLVIIAGVAGALYVANVRAERDKAIKDARQHYELYQGQRRVNADLVNASIREKQLQEAAKQNIQSAAKNKEAFKNATTAQKPSTKAPLAIRESSQTSATQRVAVPHVDSGSCHLTVDAVRVLNASLAGQAVDRSTIGTGEGQATSTVSCRTVGEVLIDTASQYHDLASKHDALVDSICRSDAGSYNPGCSQYESGSSSTTSSSFGE